MMGSRLLNQREIEMNKELQGLRKILEYLWDGNQEAFTILYFFKNNYKEWPLMLKWLKDNGIKGQKIVDLCKNESSDGGGYHMGATYIFNRMKGNKNIMNNINASDLL